MKRAFQVSITAALAAFLLLPMPGLSSSLDHRIGSVALSGRVISVHDDLDDLARRADEIVRENRHTVRFVE